MGRSVSGDWILARTLWSVEQFALSHGLDWEAIASKFGFDPKVGYDQEATIPISTLFSVVNHIVRETGIDSMGFELGSTVPVGFSSTLDYVAVAAPSLREGLNNWVRFATLSSNGISIHFEERDGKGMLEWRVPERFGPRSQHLFSLCAWTYRRIQYITGIEGLDVVIELSVPPPKSPSSFMSKLGSRLRFGQDNDRMVIPEAYLGMAHHSAEPNLYRIVEQTAIAELQAQGEEDDLLFAVCEVLGEAIKNGHHSLQDTASALGMTPRTLQRKLAACGTSFRDLIENIRKNLASHYLTDTTLPLTEIAFLLGFSDLSSFSRSARIWYGVGPREFRRRAAG